MANRRYDLMTPRKGKDKTFWHRVGTAWENDKGIQCVFDSLPIPDAEGRCVVNLFEPREDNARSVSNDRADARERSSGGGAYPRGDDMDDSIPFITRNTMG